MPYFDQSLYRFDELQPSYWEATASNRKKITSTLLKVDKECDVVIIGGGYTGLSAAYHLSGEYNLDVSVLEAGEFGWGASGRNGGFCCIGGVMLSTAQQIRKFGLKEVQRYYSAQADAIELVQTLQDENGIDAERVGNGEMEVAESPKHFQEFADYCDFANKKLDLNFSMISQEEFRETQYDAPHQNGAILERPSFAIHPLKYCLGLAEAAQKKGANLHHRSKVVRWEKSGSTHQLITCRGTSIKARNVIVACNGFMPEKLHKGLSGKILPLQSQILVTRALSPEELKLHNWQTLNPAINSRNVYFYYRMLPDNRFLIGGRADFHGTQAGAEKTALQLKASFNELWPNWHNIEVDYSWRGLVCFSSKMHPSIGRLDDDPSVSLAFGYHGNGVNNATWAGRELARWLATGNSSTQTKPTHLPAMFQGTTPSFPLSFMRRNYARIGVGWHRFKDMID